jgi:hypothetical protein
MMKNWLPRGVRRDEELLPPLPVPARIPLPTRVKEEEIVANDPEREVTIKAAQAFDRAVREREELRRLLDQANLGLEVKNSAIMDLEVKLSEEKSRVLSYQSERDEAVDARINAEARLADIKAILERAELPPSPRRRRKRTDLDAGNGNGHETVPEGGGGKDPLAEFTAVVAHGNEVLGQQPKVVGSKEGGDDDTAKGEA